MAARVPAHLLLARILEERLMVELVAARVMEELVPAAFVAALLIMQEHVPAELLAAHAEVLFLRHLCPSQTPPEKRRPAISRRRSCLSQ